MYGFRDFAREKEILKYPIESLKAIQHLSYGLNTQIGIINRLIFRICEVSADDYAKMSESERNCLFFLLQATGSSSATLLHLSVQPGTHTRDCFSIARSIIELCINTCFLVASSTSDDALAHAKQKMVRLNARAFAMQSGLTDARKLAKMQINSRDEDVQSLLERFSRRNGSEITWNEKRIEERIDVIRERFGSADANLLEVSYAGIYGLASEMIHGSVFSGMYFLMPQEKGQCLYTHIADNHMLTLIMVVNAITALTSSLNSISKDQEIEDMINCVVEWMRRIPTFNNDTNITKELKDSALDEN